MVGEGTRAADLSRGERDWSGPARHERLRSTILLTGLLLPPLLLRGSCLLHVPLLAA